MGIEERILLVRGRRVMLDSDLAQLYGVPTKHLNQQVRRNIGRFPADFMFQLDSQEAAGVLPLRLQFATLNNMRGRHRKYLPLVFTEQGVAMLSSVLNSERAIQVNIAIVRTFVRLRDLRRFVDELERKYDGQFKEVFGAIRKLMSPEFPAKPLIGFKP